MSYVTGPSESRKVGRESAEPGTCSFCSEPGGQGPRPALDSTERGLLLGQERNRAGPWAGCRGTGTPPTGQRPPWAHASCLEPLPPQAPASTPPSLVDLSHRAPSGRQARCRAPWHRSGRHMWPPSTPQGRDLSRNEGGWVGSAPWRWHCVGHERGGCKGPCPGPACSTGAQQDLQVHATIPGPKSSGVSRPLSGPRDFRLGPHPAKKRFRGGLPQRRIHRNLTFPRCFRSPSGPTTPDPVRSPHRPQEGDQAETASVWQMSPGGAGPPADAELPPRLEPFAS